MYLLTITILSFSLLNVPAIDSQTVIALDTQTKCEDLALYIKATRKSSTVPGTRSKMIVTCKPL